MSNYSAEMQKLLKKNTWGMLPPQRVMADKILLIFLVLGYFSLILVQQPWQCKTNGNCTEIIILALSEWIFLFTCLYLIQPLRLVFNPFEPLKMKKEGMAWAYVLIAIFLIFMLYAWLIPFCSVLKSKSWTINPYESERFHYLVLGSLSWLFASILCIYADYCIKKLVDNNDPSIFFQVETREISTKQVESYQSSPAPYEVSWQDEEQKTHQMVCTVISKNAPIPNTMQGNADLFYHKKETPEFIIFDADIKAIFHRKP